LTSVTVHAVHADGRQGMANFVSFEGFDDGDDEFHESALPFPGVFPASEPVAVKSGIFEQMAQKIAALSGKHSASQCDGLALYSAPFPP